MTEILKEAKEKRSKKINKIEVIKALKSPLSVYERLEELSKAGYEALADEDKKFFLKCFGIFDKGDDHFMIRVRIPGGKLSAMQATRIGELAKEHGRDYIDLTTRMQVELRYIKTKSLYPLIKGLEEVGITTFQTGVDNPRNFLTDPLDELAYDNIIACKPLIDAMQAAVVGSEAYIATLPRKFNTGILGSLSNSCNIYGQDCAFVLANKDGVFGFNLYLGGRVGMQTIDADIFVKEEEVVEVFTAILDLFREYGYRDNRNKNRLIFLLQDVGMKAFKAALEEHLGRSLPSAGQNLVQSALIAQSGNKVLLKDNTFAYKLIVASGIFSGTDMMEAAALSQKYGNGNLRLSYDQNISIIGIPESEMEAFEQEEFIAKYALNNFIYMHDTIACAGIDTCSYGVIPNKPDAIELANYLKDALPLDEGHVRLNWSACPKGCGVHGIADIGFEGCKAKYSDGTKTDGVHLFLGGKITSEAKEAHILHKALPLDHARIHVKHLIRAYAMFKKRGEIFERFEERFLAANYSYQAIAFYTRINHILESYDLGVTFDLEESPKSGKREEFEIFSFGIKLFKLLTGQKRFEVVEGLDPVLVKPRSIDPDTVIKINPKVPELLSHVIYKMTHEQKRMRPSVFSEILLELKAL